MSLINRLREWRESQSEHKAAAEEMQFHIEQETERNIRFGMSPEAAHRAAMTAFGGVDRFAEAARDERTGTRLADFKASWLDWKLGGRMLLKYPGLSLIGGVTLAAAIGVGAGWFDVSMDMRHPKLPLADGDRIVRLENWDAAAAKIEFRALHDFFAWREQLTSIEHFGAYRALERNLITPDGRSEPVQVAEISASAFPLTRVPPLLGRPLTDADAQPDAGDVVVIGYDIWHSRFSSDPNIIGRIVQLGRSHATVVGVMPEGFGFPISQQAWTPLRAAQTPPREGAAIDMFGRLTPGTSLKTAQAELAAIGQRMAAANPATHAQLRPRVLPYALADATVSEFVMMTLAAWLILGAACANVATLMFARTALRESEIVVRTALGASRMRVMGQLFVESLVLTGVAAAVGLAGASLMMKYIFRMLVERGHRPPFWWNDTIEPLTILYTAGLAVAGAVLVGLLPAIKATGPHVQAGLRNMGSGGNNMRFGGVWSVIIVAQVALTVIGLPLGIATSRQAIGEHRVRSAFPSHAYLTLRPELDRDAVAGTTRELSDDELRTHTLTVLEELERRIESDPTVAAVTFARTLPGTGHWPRPIEVQRGTGAPYIAETNIDGNRVRLASVGIDFFDAFSIPVISGRSFHAGDVDAQNGAVIINESLAKSIGGNPVGLRVRHAATTYEEASEWYEVVGVVRNLGLDPVANGDEAFMWTPISRNAALPPRVIVRVNGDAAAFAPQLRTLAAQVDPSLRLYDVLSLQEVIRRNDLQTVQLTLIGVGVVLLAIGLSAAGLFALMSVSVGRRTREIGIRLAIGASPRAVLRALFARAATQVGVGIVVGNVLLIWFLSFSVDDLQARVLVVPLLTASLVMALVGLLSCWVPARRALRIQPTEALKGAR